MSDLATTPGSTPLPRSSRTQTHSWGQFARCLTLVTLCCAWSSSALAASDDWEREEDARAAEVLASTFHTIATPSKAWRVGEVEAMRLGLESLPEFLLPTSDAPMYVERRINACLFGMGRDNRTCPTFSKDGRTFYIYTMPPLHGEGATRSQRSLNAAERVTLWRARAMVHMALSHKEDELEWSERRIWRQINGWKKNGRRAFNRDTWGYSRFQGAQNARQDLITFAEEYFVRPEDVLRLSPAKDAAERYAEYDWDLSLGCQEFTKSRILLKLVQEVDATYDPAVRGPEGIGPRQVCQQFERWAMSQDVEGIDILLAAATSDRPESLYGHLLLTVRYREGQTVRSRGFDPVYQYGAITDTDVNKIEYFAKGLFGGFLSVIQPNTFRGTDRLFMQYEQRTLRRYALNLSPQQVRQVMERLWEAERRIMYPYYFLSDNCASMLIDVLAPAIDELDLPDPIRFGLMPTEVLDVFAAVENGDRGPLLVKRTETHFSSREVAMDAVPRRREALSVLTATLSKGQTQALERHDKSLDGRDPITRKESYEALRITLDEVLVADATKEVLAKRRLAAIDYLYYSSRVERYFMDLAFYQRRMLQAGALKEPLQFTAEEQIAMRRALFEEEDLQKRQEAMLALASMSDERLRDGERREFTPKEQETLEEIKRTQAAYLASLEALASTIETHTPNLDGVTFIRDKTETFELAQSRRDRLSMGPAGKGRIMVGGGAGQISGLANSGTAGFFDLSASLVYERLGEQRRRGFRSDISSRALGVDMEGIVDQDGVPLWKQLKVDGTLFEFMTVEQLLGPVRKSWRDAFGWGLKLGIQHDGRRGLQFAAVAEGGYVYPIWQRDNVSNFLVAGLYGALRTDWTVRQLDDPDLAGVRAFLMAQFHLYGAYANVLRLDASTTQYARFDVWLPQHQWEVTARAQTEHRVAEINQQLLLVRPYVLYEYTTLNYRQDEAFSTWRGGVTFELPF